jgi:hypothetical protein
MTTNRPEVLPGRYRDTLTDIDHAVIAARDLPAGLPVWLPSPDASAARTGDDTLSKWATIYSRRPTLGASMAPGDMNSGTAVSRWQR